MREIWWCAVWGWQSLKVTQTLWKQDGGILTGLTMLHWGRVRNSKENLDKVPQTTKRLQYFAGALSTKKGKEEIQIQEEINE